MALIHLKYKYIYSNLLLGVLLLNECNRCGPCIIYDVKQHSSIKYTELFISKDLVLFILVFFKKAFLVAVQFL